MCILTDMLFFLRGREENTESIPMWPRNGRIIKFVSSSQLFLCSPHQGMLPFRPQAEAHGAQVPFSETGMSKRTGSERKGSPAVAFRKSRFIYSISITPMEKITSYVVLKTSHLLPWRKHFKVWEQVLPPLIRPPKNACSGLTRLPLSLRCKQIC